MNTLRAFGGAQKFAAEIAVLFQELRACSQARVYVFNKGSHFP